MNDVGTAAGNAPGHVSGTGASAPGTGAVLSPHRCAVIPEWIDYNGHMSEAFYVLVFGFATDAVMDALGMDAAYRAEKAASLYTVEAHVRYLAEASLGDQLEVQTTVVGSGAKKLHLAHEMWVGGTLVSTEELLALHVNTATGRTQAFDERTAALIAGYAPTPGLEPPDWVGRTVNR